MHLTEWEKEKLITFAVAKLAEERMERGMKLSYPEAVAVITFKITEEARTGKYKVSDLQEMGHKILSEADVMDGVPALADLINVQVVMPDGNKLIVIHKPFQSAKVENIGGQGGQQQGNEGNQGGEHHNGH